MMRAWHSGERGPGAVLTTRGMRADGGIRPLERHVGRVWGGEGSQTGQGGPLETSLRRMVRKV